MKVKKVLPSSTNSVFIAKKTLRVINSLNLYLKKTVLATGNISIDIID